MLIRIFILILSGSIFATTPSLNQTSADALLRQQKQQIKSIKRNFNRLNSVKIPKFKSSLFKKHKHIRFTLKKVNIHGATQLKNLKLESIFAPFYGKKISLSKLQHLVEKSTDTMLAKGFILSHAYLPEQTINKGIVKVNVVQGFISNYQVVGKLNKRNRVLLDKYISSVIRSKIFNSKKLEKALMSINMLPGVSVKSVISPDKKTPNAATLTLFTTQLNYNLLAIIDNFANRLQGREQVLIGGSSYANFLQGELSTWVGHSLENQHSRSFSLLYKKMLENYSKISLSFNISDSVPDYAVIGLPSLNDQGLAKEFSIKYSHPVVLTRNLSNIIFGKFVIHDSDMENLDTNSLTFRDKVRSIEIGDKIKFNDRLKGSNTFLLSITQGIDGFEADNSNPSRVDGVLDFTKFNILLNRNQPLFNNLSWKLLTMGQYSFNPLLVSEEFNLGGNGYDFGEIAGDRGYSVYNEFYYNLNPKLFNLQFYGFHYVGTAFNINDLSQLRRESLASAGFGARFLFNKNVSANLYIAKPLTRIVSLEGNTDARLFFSLNYNISK